MPIPKETNYTLSVVAKVKKQNIPIHILQSETKGSYFEQT